MMFRSLFSWITVAGYGTLISAYLRNTMFRSLFSWITVAGNRLRRGPLALLYRFDPCSPGSPSPAPATQHAAATVDRFRSLFSWITVAGVAADAQGRDE